MSKKTYRIIDLFAGVGGFRVAFNQANDAIGKELFKVIWGNQWEPGRKVQYAAEIYKKAFGEDGFVNEDIAKVKTADIPNHDIVVGGFPCQDYSVATTKKLSNGIEGKKGVLWWQIERIIREKAESGDHPEILIFENVDRLISSPAKQRGRDFAIMLTCLDLLGYMVEWRVIDASEYGYPQRRKRIYFVGYRKDSKIYKSFKGDFESWLTKDGLFASGFPVNKKSDKAITKLHLYEGIRCKKRSSIIKEVSDNFNQAGTSTPFKKAGLLFNGHVVTLDVETNYQGEKKTLGEILITDEKEIPDEFFIPKEEYDKWRYLKGAKKEKRIQKSTGYEYQYAEGAITYPDALDRPSRTIITGEGGKAPSRFKHVVRTESGRLRRLTPVELERLDMFPDNHTVGYSSQTRAFLMGNALVVGVIQKIAETLYEKL
ncbi:MAG: (cytosine-5-)-methyltransferase, DNA (cytosine-5-)-methyltransferase protein [candidate division WS6 bacterium GW2011_GWC1_33_20]|uniref:Cytosine-specific methyltransferase n=1 Tax=candidate division WS6 bacterium GW2011_GWC1_33_20 TaxID=1619089 RepID=A0A0G0CHF2_9BACT|nr:MAG: (cytosine-5-)-methyltransferase, DNA (cytosine-5-)-methyltransferase protein [candidate division WS6 bacterium GW2011_GWC1_33_20]KKP43301.1 MAG: (cytosine-5-)-methyltransferase, DNA (cytosine-5-)-methyltransferase protein [candidate division WS6 bacterium GW2011_GWE2_33_157]KKP45769.1 MAG: (cytosine-5-)-methyltransferase, DNA (cytosine-5-)-methyltransferase protein [candidate division WS6 bacterium GW2011_GWF1_33_233]KKP55212.1 MAG: (cytosine-5-)-methyltransferase, DNA (cytosine-5-)-meth